MAAPCLAVGRALSNMLEHLVIEQSARCCEDSQLRVVMAGITNMSLETCAQKCDENAYTTGKSAPGCLFFSYAKRYRLCELCTGCRLMRCAGAPGSCFQGDFTSYSRAIPAANFALTATAPIRQLHAALSQEYSEAVYGAAGRMPAAHALRVVWAALLPPRAMAVVSRVGGACTYDAQPPHRPFYSSHDLVSNPEDSIWIGRREPDVPISNDTWVEVTHCPRALPPSALGMINPGDEWMMGPMWAYVAPGSGVSVNVGRTLVLTSYRAARRLLMEAFPAATNHSCHGGVRHVQMDHPLARVDTVQVLGHKEYFSAERRHELIFLRAGECDALGGALATRVAVRCGRYPHLQANCPPAALSRVSECRPVGRTSYSTPALQQQVQSGRCAPSGCYADVANGEHFCPPAARASGGGVKKGVDV